MTETEKAEQRVVAMLQSQIDRLTKATCCLRDPCAEANTLIADSELGREIVALRQSIGEQWSIINDFKVTKFLCQLDEVLRENTQNAKVDRMACEREALINELEELDAAILRVTRNHADVKERLKNYGEEATVLEDLLSSAHDDRKKFETSTQ